MKKTLLISMIDIIYVYPNVSELNRGGRGSLAARWELANELGCDYVEMPADFIKNKTEIQLTGLDLGAFLSDDAIRLLYDTHVPVPANTKYILHTEPSLFRTDGYGIKHQSRLRWYSKTWVEDFIDMVTRISKHIGIAASVIEIHPGDRGNSYADIIEAARLLIERYDDIFSFQPTILLENRTGQFISTGADIATFWAAVAKSGTDIRHLFGVVLDIQQLYTATKADFVYQFQTIPLEAIKGLHIHSKHRTPTSDDSIPWDVVFGRLTEMKGQVLINPEIHHKKHVPNAIKFCERMMRDVR